MPYFLMAVYDLSRSLPILRAHDLLREQCLKEAGSTGQQSLEKRIPIVICSCMYLAEANRVHVTR